MEVCASTPSLSRASHHISVPAIGQVDSWTPRLQRVIEQATRKGQGPDRSAGGAGACTGVRCLAVRGSWPKGKVVPEVTGLTG